MILMCNSCEYSTERLPEYLIVGYYEILVNPVVVVRPFL